MMAATGSEVKELPALTAISCSALAALTLSKSVKSPIMIRSALSEDLRPGLVLRT